MGDAAFLVMPSVNYEGFPKTIVEALSRGTPVIASKLGAMAEIVESGRTGLHFEPGNPEDLASKVHELAANPEQAAEMRRNARLTYEEHYTAESNYRLLLEIYERAIRSRPNPTSRRPGAAAAL
jgi:glycosyltransferase involved in cell wall biosynthesis